MSEHTPLTAEELDAIEARANAATPGPCRALNGMVYSVGANERPICTKLNTRENAQDAANMEFVAGAFDDVPLLVAEVRALQEYSIRLLTQVHNTTMDQATRNAAQTLIITIEELKAENERLRGALQRIADQEPRQALGKRWVCPWCESYDHDGGHRDDCPWQIAADALGVELPKWKATND